LLDANSLKGGYAARYQDSLAKQHKIEQAYGGPTAFDAQTRPVDNGESDGRKNDPKDDQTNKSHCQFSDATSLRLTLTLHQTQATARRLV
jgi:hypothetical protein